jgi:hypothetical protein
MEVWSEILNREEFHAAAAIDERSLFTGRTAQIRKIWTPCIEGSICARLWRTGSIIYVTVGGICGAAGVALMLELSAGAGHAASIWSQFSGR